jgi:outer membrane receptor protein involved in Fe transport
VLGDVRAALADSDTQATLGSPIAAQPLAQALQAFSRQTGLHVAYVSGIVRNQTSQAVPAGLTPTQALARLLEGTGLKFEYLTASNVRILADERPTGAPAPGEVQGPLPSVTVTGSRIAVPANISATSPLVVVTAQDVVLTGYTDTGDVIRALPQMVTTGADSGGYSIGGYGTVTADLRGLGPQRTVVLINGRRLGVGDANTGNLSPAPDLDQIPLPMIERVEVLTGGASATYGSDAVAGVVNFILKDHVQGVQIDAQYGVALHTQHEYDLQGVEAASGYAYPTGTTTDGSTRDVSILAGTGLHDGAGQITGYFIYHDQDALYGSDRDFTACPFLSLNAATGVPSQGGVKCQGSSRASNYFLPNAGDAGPYSVVGTQLVPYPAAGSIPPPTFNFAPYQSVERQDTRYQAGLLARVELSPAARPYLEFNFMDDRSVLHQAPSGLFTGLNPFTADGNFLVNCSNPLLSAEEAAVLCTPAEIAADKAHPGAASGDVAIGRRNIEGGPRLTTYAHRNYRAVAGVDGRLSDAWSYDAYALYYTTSLLSTNQNNLNLVAANKALQVTTDQSARPVCISGGSCVPYDIFTTGAVTPQQLAYLNITGTDGGTNTEQIIEADVTGELDRYGLIAPWAREGVALNAGAEHRAETLKYAPDATELSGAFAGAAFVALDNRVSVDEGFVEMRMPIAQHQPLINDLTVGAGYRYSVYSTAGSTNTYRVDLQFAPLADVRIRTSFDRVVRAPNLIELYTPLTEHESLTVLDPCAPIGAAHATASLAQCVRMGVTAAQYGNGIAPAFGGTNTIRQCFGGCAVAVGGNPGLAPETADTWSLGVTLTPAAIPGFTASVDYFHILLKGAIATIPEEVTLNQCLASGDPTWCGHIVRTSAGALSGPTVAGGGYIAQWDLNTGTALVSGIDVQANYRQPLPGRWGALTASLNGSWLQRESSTPYESAASYDCAGLFGATCNNGSVNPTWRHNLRVTWEMPWDLQLSAQWRFIGRTDFDNNSPQIALQNQEIGFFDPVLTHIPNYSYLDLAALWNVTEHVQVRTGVNNVLDKDPPFLPSLDINTAGSFNTLPGYDIAGRELYVALRATF